ncbi:MAG TPA: hypothetical protein EYG26_03080 [Planctomycetes bacterium]|nr:hypothetical protein [Planctomycetota bacterium]
MTIWILAVLGLFIAQTLLPSAILASSFRNRKLQRDYILGPRDISPPMPGAGERAERALNNMKEALPVFVTLALLAAIQGTSTTTSAQTGAMVFFFARLLYVPAYISGIRGIRSSLWVVSMGGLGMLTYGLLN